MAGSDASEGQAVCQPGGAEEDSRLREGNRHLHLAYDDEEEEKIIKAVIQMRKRERERERERFTSEKMDTERERERERESIKHIRVELSILHVK